MFTTASVGEIDIVAVALRMVELNATETRADRDKPPNNWRRPGSTSTGRARSWASRVARGWTIRRREPIP